VELEIPKLLRNGKGGTIYYSKPPDPPVNKGQGQIVTPNNFVVCHNNSFAMAGGANPPTLQNYLRKSNFEQSKDILTNIKYKTADLYTNALTCF
jgi:hypothetical protein